ncbi:hypothetical protein AXK11_05085 [Cephaloticoccus primus]|uniref:Glycosyl transferase family 9 n=1 Tax=Cephaloticoccus primus TaxID=1548207 RepID=A0A139SMS0_9BACT|nr:glycosyltransferase family 9 protein [Cephaloticoccus primus]KXU35906.1 hypothetical protein AXK11_05085 [Cephaloticoccus primus]
MTQTEPPPPHQQHTSSPHSPPPPSSADTTPARAQETPPDRPRLLLIRRRYLGDIVLLGSVLKNLRLHWPTAQIALLADRAYAPVAALHPEVDRVRSFPAKLTQWPRFIRELRCTRFTHVFDFDNSDRTALVTRLTAAPIRLTYEREGQTFRHRWAYTGSVKLRERDFCSQHITETYLQLIAASGVSIRTREVSLPPRPADLAHTQRFAAPHSATTPASPGGPTDTGRAFHTAVQRPRILVHPGSRSRYRVWPAERFAAVCDRLQDELDAQVFLVAGAGERGTAQAIRAAAQSHLVLIDEALSIGGLAALCSRFDLMLCHDSGPMHLAAAVGTPVVALFGSQNAANWSPLGQGHQVLQTALPCTCLPDTPTPCQKDDSYRSYCVRKLSPETVFNACAQSLAYLQQPDFRDSA